MMESSEGPSTEASGCGFCYVSSAPSLGGKFEAHSLWPHAARILGAFSEHPSPSEPVRRDALARLLAHASVSAACMGECFI